MIRRDLMARHLLEASPVTATDRAFRALARADPAAVLALLRAALPGLLAGARIDATSVEDPALDLPPPVEADLVARAGSRRAPMPQGGPTNSYAGQWRGPCGSNTPAGSDYFSQ